ncbi:MAG: S41 family peptidase [Deltaproteobacteria bacterium]|nr:MAG: S41 family peptidase [Deltaproteobacteria bacterium]TMB39750.1 MAG: S41 family peptidase [Deltaproteobacteria bacterium]
MPRIFVAALCCASAASAFTRPPDFAVAPAQRTELVEGVYQHLQQYYVFPERLGTALPALRQKWDSETFRKLDHAHALVDRMNEDLKNVFHDGHLSVRLAAALPPGFFDDPDHPDPKMVAEEEEFERRTNFGIGKVEVLPDGIGYLEIKGFAGRSRGEQQAYAKAMTELKDSRALVIDLRGNGGGDGDTVADLVGYLLDKKTLLQWDIQRGGKELEHFSAEKVDGPRYGEKRPVYVLTSNRTFSAAEECAYDLQTQKRAVIVGEHTGGGANHNRFFRIAKDFAVSIPYMTTKNAVTGKNWEGTGVQPDVAALQINALDAARRLAAEKLAASK